MLKATLREHVLSPLELRLVKARELYIKLATEKERLACDVAELRLDSVKRELKVFGQTRKQIRAEADLASAQKLLLAAIERAAKQFDEETKS